MGARKVTAAGRKLRKHLRKTGVSVPAWCLAHGIEAHRATIQRLISGERYRAIPADTILLVQRLMRADGGEEIPVEDFGSQTARRAS